MLPIVLGQCLPSLSSQLEIGKDFEKICKENNVVELLKLRRGFSCHHDQNKNNIYTVLNRLRALFVNYQRSETTNDDYLKKFQADVSTLDNLNANILSNIPCLLEDEVEGMYSKAMKDASEEEMKNARKMIEQQNAKRLLLIGANGQRYGNMKSNMQLNMVMGTNNYPDLLEEVMYIMNAHQQTKWHSNICIKDGNQYTEMNFGKKGQMERKEAMTLVRSHAITVVRKGAMQKLAQGRKMNMNKCIKKLMKVGNMMMMMMTKSICTTKLTGIKNGMRLIDSQRTIDVFKNKTYLTDINTAGKPCRVQCNAGMIQVSKKGMFGNIPVWYHPKGVANILSLKILKEKYHVTYDSNVKGGVFKVKTPGGIVKFKLHKNGFHYLDTNPDESSAITLVTTVRDNFEGFAMKEIE